MRSLKDLFLDAMQAEGYDLVTACEHWHDVYRPEILSLPIGKYIYTIGRHEITFKKIEPVLKPVKATE